MTGADNDWSPADNPYAIAVSQSWFAINSLTLFASKARSELGPEQQIYARQIFGQLRLLRRCAGLQAGELKRLGVPDVHRDRLDQAIAAFDEATEGATDARNILEHFDEYARGKGKLQRKAIKDQGMGLSEAAALYWGGGYDPTTEQLSEGPFVIVVPDAVAASEALYQEIYVAGKAVDSHRDA
jgi:hypothetical protein